MGIDVGGDVDRPQGLRQRTIAALQRGVLMEELLELSLLERVEGAARPSTAHLLGDLSPHRLDVHRHVAHSFFLTIGPPAVSDADRGRFSRPEAFPW